MTTEALAAALDSRPLRLAGGRVSAWHGNLRLGDGKVFVVEADEYDRSFLALEPTVATVTNVEPDHLDIYADLADIRRAFEQFLAPARTVACCVDDPGASALAIPAGAEVHSRTELPTRRASGRTSSCRWRRLRFLVRSGRHRAGRARAARARDA
jgi:UDP-N-acetylmuramate--alanine ligase